jgi:glycosyltransferase involved in cell wall biosynthesis
MNGRLPDTVLMTTDTLGGVWTYSCTLASALAAAGIDVHLVTIGPRARPDQLAMLRDSRVNLIESDLALEWQDPPGNDVTNARRILRRIEAEIEPEIIHLNSFREAGFDWKAPVLAVAHSCVNSWAIACGDTAWLTEPRWRRYTAAVTAGLRQAQAWVSPSRAFYEVMAELYHPTAPGTVIWNGIAPASFPEGKQNFIFAAGRLWDRAKNIAPLVEAARDLAWPLLIAGPVDDGLPLGATQLGQLSRAALRTGLQRAAIFASPALYEPFGLSVLEAASAGCALLLSDIPTFRELWDGAALFVDPRDNGALNRLLADLCNDDAKRTRLQRAAYTRSLRYSSEQMTAGYLRLYEALLVTEPRRHAMRAFEVQP